MPSTTRPLLPASTAALLTVRQASVLVHAHPRTVRRWIETGELPAVRTSRVRGRLLIPRGDLEAFLLERRVLCGEVAAAEERASATVGAHPTPAMQALAAGFDRQYGADFRGADDPRAVPLIAQAEAGSHERGPRL